MDQLLPSKSKSFGDEADLHYFFNEKTEWPLNTHPPNTFYTNEKERCTWILNASATLDGCDDQLLPASFRVMEAHLGLHPTLLGHITIAQLIASSISCPAWGYFADHYSRKGLLTLGLLMWGSATIGLGAVSNLHEIILLRVMNGMFLGCIGPISQSLLADICDPATRGYFFGVTQMCSCMGRVFGGVLMTSVAFLHFYNIDGWRLVFFFVGGLSVFLGIFTVWAFPDLPRSKSFQWGSWDTIPYQTSLNDVESDSQLPLQLLLSKNHPTHHSHELPQQTHLTHLETTPLNQDSWFKTLFSFIKTHCCHISIFLILLEGIMGVLSWSALAFLTLFLQYKGLSDAHAGMAASFLHIGAMVAGPFAGLVGDTLASRYPSHGRLSIGQCSMIFRIPIALLLFYTSPLFQFNPLLYGVLCFLLGICCVGGVVVNRPVLTELVIPKHRAAVFAIIISIEASVGSLLGMMLMGYMTEHLFGYIRTENLLMDAIPEDVKATNMRALSKALTLLTCIPYFFSFFFYSILHLTYKHDLRKIQKRIDRRRRHYRNKVFIDSVTPYIYNTNDLSPKAREKSLPNESLQ